jgi:hypothetical protein
MNDIQQNDIHQNNIHQNKIQRNDYQHNDSHWHDGALLLSDILFYNIGTLGQCNETIYSRNLRILLIISSSAYTFVPGNLIQPSLMFVGKSWALPLSGASGLVKTSK